MDELPPNARAFLDAVQRADDPTPNQRTRADEAARAALASCGVHDLPALAPQTSAVVSGTASGVWRLKLAVSAVVVIGAVLFAFVAVRRSAPTPRPLSPTVVQAPRAAPQIVPPSEHVPESARPDEQLISVPTERRAKSAAAREAGAQKRPLGRVRDDDALERALRVVAAANELIRRTRFHEAIQLLDETESDPAAQVMHEERTALRILARCGRAPDARAQRERERFLLESPRAVLAARVREACLAVPENAP